MVKRWMQATVVRTIAVGVLGAAAMVPAWAAPTVTLSAPVASAQYVSPASIALTATATTTTGSISKVDFYRGGTTLIGTKTAAPYTFTWSSVAAGAYSLTAKATDSTGATSTTSARTITVVNNTAPATVVLKATATDTDGSVAKVEFYNGATLLSTKTAVPYEYSWTSVAAGTYTVTAKATDNLGTATTSTALTVTVTAPNTAAAAKVHYIHSDQLNTPRVITNAANQAEWQWDQTEAFGSNLPNENPANLGTFTFNPRFPGQYFDRETGLHYNYFRDYDPDTGRYIESDPIGLAGGVNTYGYVGANPLNRIDPTGEIAVFLPWVIPAAVDAATYAATAAGAAWAAHKISQEFCPPDKPCPPCKTVSGRVVPIGTIGYRPLDVIPDNEIQHGVAGSHHNIFVAQQNPNNCQCFWQKQKYVYKPGQLPNGAIPIEQFAN